MFFLIQLDHHFLLQKPFSLPDQRCDHALLFFPVKSLSDLHLAAISIQIDHCSSCSSDSIILRSQKGFPSLHNQLECRLARKIVLSYIQLLDQPYRNGLTVNLLLAYCLAIFVTSSVTTSAKVMLRLVTKLVVKYRCYLSWLFVLISIPISLIESSEKNNSSSVCSDLSNVSFVEG